MEGASRYKPANLETHLQQTHLKMQKHKAGISSFKGSLFLLIRGSMHQKQKGVVKAYSFFFILDKNDSNSL